MTVDLMEALRASIRASRVDLIDHVKPRDETERAICDALGDCTWDECVRAIQRHRTEHPPQEAPRD